MTLSSRRDAWPAVDPYDAADPNLWIKVEHLGRYLFAAQLFAQEACAVVADVGYGTGYGLRELAAVARRVIGIDQWPSASAEEAGPAVELHHADICAPPLAELLGVAAGLCCFEVLEHVRSPERAIRTCGALLEPGGLLVASVPDAAAEAVDRAGLPANREHRRAYTFDDLELLLSTAGFDLQYRLGQGVINRTIRRERQLRGQASVPLPEPDSSPLHRPEAVRHLAAVLGMPTTSDLGGSYSITVVARRTA